MSRTPYIGIDLFAGVGGLSYGLSRAGIAMRLGLEIDSNAAFNLKQNNSDMNVVISDICKVDPIKVLENGGLRKEDIDVIAGGPPCQGFSQSNRRTRNITNPTNDLYKEYFKFVKCIRPEVFLLENVAGLKTLNKGETFRDILKIGNNLGYNIQCGIINAKDYGIPQRRNRIIFLGTRNRANKSLLKSKSTKIVTVREAIDDLPKIENGNDKNDLSYFKQSCLSAYQRKMRGKNSNNVNNNLVTKNGSLIIERYKHIPSGGNWRDIPPNLFSNYKNPENCHGWIYYRLKWDEPSVVVSNFRKNMLIHPEQHRGLSVREAARLQSFPDIYQFYGRLDFQQQLVANAVPPLLAEKIGKNITNYLMEVS